MLAIRRFSVRTFLALALLAAALGPVLAKAADEPSYGVNRVNLAWVPQDAREKILRAMAENGVRLVRLSLVPPVAESIDAVRVADRLGMRVLLVVSLNNADFYPKGSERRSGQGRTWDVFRLSEIDPRRFREGFETILERVDAAGVSLAGVQLGNEINWGAFNGDLDVHASPGAPVASSPTVLNPGSGFERGLDAYTRIARIVRQEIDRSVHNRDAQLIAAGLSDIPADVAEERGIERRDAAGVVAQLRARGLDDLIDAYGVHVYPAVSASEEARRLHLDTVVSICSAPPYGKPCWITEWGLPNVSADCPLDDDRRGRVAAEVRDRFTQLMRQGRIVAALYYDWDKTFPFSAWRCGGLTATGRAAIVAEGVGLPALSSAAAARAARWREAGPRQQ